MKYEEVSNLVGAIVENEFNHIQNYEERGFIDTDKEQKELTEVSEKLFKQLSKDMSEECKELLDDYCSIVSGEWINMCKFYFKEGIRAGLDNLNFIKEIDGFKGKYTL